jgi:hypothetical protein
MPWFCVALRRLFDGERWSLMDTWRNTRRAALRHAAEWQLEADKLRATAMQVSDSLIHEQLLMFAEDCEDQAMREANGEVIRPR